MTADGTAELAGSNDCGLEAFVIGDHMAVECVINAVGSFHVVYS